MFRRPRLPCRRLWLVILATWTIAVTPAVGELTPELRSILDARHHPDLTWSDLSDVVSDLEALYALEDGVLLWLDDGQPTDAALAATAALQAARDRGLRPEDYDAERLATRLRDFRGGSDEELARLDAALSSVLLRFVRHVSSGRIDPRRVGFGLDAEPKKVNLPESLLRIARSSDPQAEIDSLDPPFPLFGRLRRALAEYRPLAERDLPAVPDFPTLHPGETSPAAPVLRVRLDAVGDLPKDSPVPANPEEYDAVLVTAVEKFQTRHGLAADGVIGRSTIAALRVSLADRAEQIELALERLRWLPRREQEQRLLIVNIPEFRLSAFAPHRTGPVMTSEVVVGSAARRHATPILHAEMEYVVFRPYWNVPPGIARNEILPKVAVDPSYLERQDMELYKGRVRQRPGPDNSLGLVKFIFPNRHHVYLHDTPSKSLFGRARRDFSHGCIRVAKPVELAEFVLGGQGDWNRDSIVEAMQNGRNNRHIRLDQPIPVYLLYSTAVASRDGEVRFFEDIYGHDAELAMVLAKGAPYP